MTTVSLKEAAEKPDGTECPRQVSLARRFFFTHPKTEEATKACDVWKDRAFSFR